MRGRYVSPDEAAIECEFNVIRIEWPFPARYNMAPTQKGPVVRAAPDGVRTGARLHRELIPFFARSVLLNYSTTNPRVEAFRTAARDRELWQQAQRTLVVLKDFTESQFQAGERTKHRTSAVHVKDDRDAWMKATTDEAWATVKSYAEERIVSWPLKTCVNFPKNPDASLLQRAS